MTSRCVNPQCKEHLNFFGAGALYSLEKSGTIDVPRHTEFFWLCASCDASLTVGTNAAGNVIVVQRSGTPALRRPIAAGVPRLVFRSKSVPLPVVNTMGPQRLAEPVKSNPSSRSREQVCHL